MSSAIGTSIGRRESRSCRSTSWTERSACHRVPRISTGGTAGASVFVIRSCFANANAMELGPQERRERKGARPSETPTSEISGRPVVRARPALPPMIVPTAQSSGTVVLSTPASYSKDVKTTGAAVRSTDTCTIETQMQVRLQESIAVVDYEDPSATEAIEASDERTGEKLDSEEVRMGRAKEVRELDAFEVKMEVDESEMRSTPSKKIWSKWVDKRKDPSSPATRCRLYGRIEI